LLYNFILYQNYFSFFVKTFKISIQVSSLTPKRIKLNKEETEAAKADSKAPHADYLLTTNSWWVTSTSTIAWINL